MAAYEHLSHDQFRNTVSPGQAEDMRLLNNKYLVTREMPGFVTAHRVDPNNLVAPVPVTMRDGKPPAQFDRETGARLPSPRHVGSLSYETRPSTVNGGPDDAPAMRVDNVGVSSQHRRKGVASAMLDLARDKDGDIQHSHPGLLREDGAAWAKAKP